LSEARKPRALNGTAKTKASTEQPKPRGLNGTAKTKASTEQPKYALLDL
jgi:hypothetical protein